MIISTPQKFKIIHHNILMDFSKMDLTLKTLNFTYFKKRPHCDCSYLEPAVFYKVQASLNLHFKLKYLDLIYLFIYLIRLTLALVLLKICLLIRL